MRLAPLPLSSQIHKLFAIVGISAMIGSDLSMSHMRLLPLTLFGLLLAISPAGAAAGNWVAAWASSPADPGSLGYSFQSPGGFRNRSMRNVVRCSIGGQAVRLRVSNLLGTETVVFEEVYAGIQQRGSRLVGGSNKAVTFGGQRRIAVPAGAVAVSDPVNLAISPAQHLVVSLYTASAGGSVTSHPSAFHDSYISAPGNFAGNEDGNGFTLIARSWFFLSAVDVLAAPQVKGAIVAFGDSITDGDGSSLNGDKRWPDALSRRIAARGGAFSVVNSGIGGNRVLSNSSCFGISTLARLERDVLSQTGIRAVIFLQGINDIIHPELAAHNDKLKPCVNSPQVSPVELIAAYQQVAAQVHARGIRIYGGTILPYQGFTAWTKDGEAKRKAINNWIRSAGVFDAVIDFAKAVADRSNPSKLVRGFDSGDHLHLNDAGYAAMANAADAVIVRE
jgi:lysophospholipase L1-like esterase